MTLGSAASMAGHKPVAPLPFSHSFAPQVGSSIPSAPMSHGAPPRQSPLWLEAEDPPLGRILVVEDKGAIAFDLHRILREAGYRVVAPASSVSEAEALLRRGPIDCAVLDVRPIGWTPFAVADRLAASSIPFIFVTGSFMQDLPERYTGRPVVVKPYTKDQLLAALECAVSRAREQMTEPWYPVAPEKVSWPRVFPQL